MRVNKNRSCGVQKKNVDLDLEREREIEKVGDLVRLKLCPVFVDEGLDVLFEGRQDVGLVEWFLVLCPV